MPVEPARRRKRLLAIALSLSAALLVAELAVRAILGAPLVERLPLMMMRANPQRGWEMVPGLEHYTYQHPVHVNALGLRGPELGVKGADERRVLFLGDSLTYGQGVADDRTVPAALERALHERDADRPWTVVNAGNRAYDTAQELALLDELGERIQPDVVLLGWYWNDLHERSIQDTYARLKDKGELAFDTGNRMEGWDRFAWRAKQLTRRSALVMWVHDLCSGSAQPLDPGYVEKKLQRLGRLLESFRERCARLGATPVLVIFPDALRLAGEQLTRPIDERASALARERGLAVVELLPALEPLHASSGKLPVLPFDGHYDERANAAMGEHLAGQLLALGVSRRAE